MSVTLKLAVYSTPWGPCVLADELVSNLGTTLAIVIQHVGPRMHVGTFKGVHKAYVEVAALHLIPGCVLVKEGPKGVSGITGVDGISGIMV